MLIKNKPSITPVIPYQDDGVTPNITPGLIQIIGSIDKSGAVTQGSVVVAASGGIYTTPVQYIKGFDKIAAQAMVSGTALNWDLYIIQGPLPTGANFQSISTLGITGAAGGTGASDNIFPHVQAQIINHSANPLTIQYLVIGVKGR